MGDMKKFRLATSIMTILWLFYLIYNTYFGWNEAPINEAEKTCDFIFSKGVIVAIGIYLMPLLDLYQRIVKSNE